MSCALLFRDMSLAKVGNAGEEGAPPPPVAPLYKGLHQPVSSSFFFSVKKFVFEFSNEVIKIVIAGQESYYSNAGWRRRERIKIFAFIHWKCNNFP